MGKQTYTPPSGNAPTYHPKGRSQAKQRQRRWEDANPELRGSGGGPHPDLARDPLPPPPPTGTELFRSALRHIPDPPDLQPYEGPVAVPLTPSVQRLVDYTEDLFFDPQSSYRRLASGEPDYGDVQTLINQGRRNFEQNVLPGIEDSFSGGPLGSTGQTGAARAAEAGARADLGEFEQQLRISERQRADSNALQALSLTPSLASPFLVELQNEMQNTEREIEIHFQNENLNVTEYKLALAEVTAALSLAEFEFNVESYHEQVELQLEMRRAQEKAAKGGLLGGALGSIGGAIVGAALAPATGGASLIAAASLGASVGGQVGTSVGTLAAGGNPSAVFAGGGGVGSNLGSDLAQVYSMDRLSGGSIFGSGRGGSVGNVNQPYTPSYYSPNAPSLPPAYNYNYTPTYGPIRGQGIPGYVQQ